MLKCFKCGTENDDSSKFCKECGCNLTLVTDNTTVDGNVYSNTNTVVHPFSNLKKSTLTAFSYVKKIAKNKIFISVIVIFILTCTGIGIYHRATPVNNFIYLIEHQKSTKATELYKQAIEADDEKKSHAKNILENKLDKIYASYYDKHTTFEDAVSKVNIYKGYSIISAKQQEIASKLNSLNASRLSFKEATVAEKNGDASAAIKAYKNVIEEDENFATATQKIEQIKSSYISEKTAEAEGYIGNKQYAEAINCIQTLIDVVGEDQSLIDLKTKYQSMKSEQYAKIVLTDKGAINRDTDKWIFSDYITFIFSVTNNTQKPIKGIEGTATFYDLFGKKILSMGCDFTGTTINPGKTHIEDGLSFECNQFIDSHTKLFNTSYQDLKFEYEIKSIVFTDGTSINPT